MADNKITEYNSHAAPATGDQFFMIGASEEYRIDYDALANAILNKLTSKTYSGINNNVIDAIAALNSRLTNSFYIKATGQSGSANNTLKITPTGADTLEHLIFAYGYGAGQKMFCFIMYARKSSNIISILNLSSALEGTASFDSDGNILVELSNWMSGYIFSRHEVNVSYMSS